jgi:adenylate cyclase
MERKLAAILAADVVGYSRLVREDEEGTVAAVGSLISEVFEPKISHLGGRIFKTMGDAVLAEFASIVDAVRCAVEIQRALSETDRHTPGNRRIAFRIGIHLGDVIVDGEDVQGDGVNVAARIEGLAKPGGICISEDTYRQMQGRLDVGFEDIGPQRLKNIDRPVRVYRVLPDAKVPGRVVVAAGTRLRRWKWPAVAATVVVLAAVILGSFGILPLRQPAPDVEPASIERMAFPLPDKPSLAVLPFVNLGDDPAQSYFADGMTDDLITDLSRVSGLFVIARNSVFTYKGKAVKVQQVAEDLGVRYVLEGSVRRAGDKVRINARLTDAITGLHLWAERYDDDLDDIFALQDKVIARIVSALAVELTDTERENLVVRRQTVDLEAYEYLLRGRQHLSRITRKDSAKAQEMFEKAVALDSNYARAYTNLGLVYFNEWHLWGNDRDANLGRALELGKKAVALDDTSAGAHVLIALVHLYRKDFARAEIEADKALALQPTHPETLGNLGYFMWRAGRPEDGIRMLEKAVRLDPYHPPHFLSWLGHSYFMAGKCDEAIRVLREGIAREPDYIAYHLNLAACYALAGRGAEAGAAASEVLRLNPNFTLRAYEGFVVYKNRSDMDRDLMAFGMAGLPD